MGDYFVLIIIKVDKHECTFHWKSDGEKEITKIIPWLGEKNEDINRQLRKNYKSLISPHQIKQLCNSSREPHITAFPL